MGKTLYVGNLPWATGEDELQQLFAEHVEVLAVRIITDRQTGRSRGFGFVDVAEGDAEKAIEALNGVLVDGRALVVTEAKSRQPL
jgi:RNA recognition motif-containing protein